MNSVKVAVPAASNCFAFLPMMLETSVATPPAREALKGFVCQKISFTSANFSK